MLANKSLKFKIVTAMVGLSLLTTLLTSAVGIVKASDIITNGAKETFALNAKTVTEQIYTQLGGVEKNAKLMSDLISNSSSIQSPAGKNKLRSSLESEYARIRMYPKTVAQNTKWVQSVYFYFDQQYATSYDGAWYIKENGAFQRTSADTVINRQTEGNEWYFNAVDLKKGIWSEPYTDTDLNMPMITYSVPVYKNGFLLGVLGMDISLSELNKILDDINIYKNTEAFMIDNKFNVIAGKKFNTGDNLLKADNGRYSFLESALKNNSNGFSQYKNALSTHIVAYSKLPNNFILIIEVPLKNIPTKLTGTVLTLICLGFLIVLITGIIALKLGFLMANPINKVVYGMSDYANELSDGANAYLALSQNLAEGSIEQAASIQETASTLEESASMVEQNNKNTTQAVILAKNTKEAASKSEREMKEVVQSMEKLKSSSREIVKITEVINGIAFQTNLLALNAAVEAARAGDAGLGFAVVAEEVRSLAKKTAEATSDISEIIKTNINLSEISEQLIKKANDSLAEINVQAQKVTELLDEISISSEEQATGISQITISMNQIEQVVQTNATNAESIAQASEELLKNVKSGIGQIEQIVNGTEL